MSVGQESFARAVMRPGTPLSGLSAPGGGPAGKRLDVYRNNVVLGLVKALEAAFPVVARLLGERFRALAVAFVRAHPPVSPVMQGYGGAFPGWLERQEAGAEAPFLGDLARLELALREAYHAADAEPAPERLGALPAERLHEARLTLAPAVRVLRSRWPVLSIWRHHQPEPGPTPGPAPEDVLVVRPAFDPEAHHLPPGGADMVAALARGVTLGEAVGSADAGAVLGLLVRGGAIVDARLA